MGKYKCPDCKNILIDDKYLKKQYCPQCQKFFYYRSGKYVTEDEAYIIDWHQKIKGYGVDRKQIQRTKEKLSERFGKEVGPKVVIWKILSELYEHQSDNMSKVPIIRLMALNIFLIGSPRFSLL